MFFYGLLHMDVPVLVDLQRLASIIFFSFFSNPISFIFAPTDWEQLMNFTTFHNKFLSLNEFFNSFQCFKWQLFGWNHVSFQLGIPNHLLKSARTVF